MATRPAPPEPAPHAPHAPHAPSAPPVAPDAERATPRCANCDTPVDDAYCPHCGQEQHDLHRSMRSLFAEALDSLAGWDGKIPATLWLLVRHPGRLTTEFLAGRRARYLRPLRLYLTLSLVYFVTLNLDWGDDDRVLNVQTSGPADRAEARADSIAEARTDSIADARADSIAGAAAARAPRRARATPDTTTLGGRLEHAFEQRVERFQRLPKEQRNRAFTSAFFGQLSNMVFALVPVFALLLRVTYRRAPLFYAEHLVHALHLHAFAMLVMTVVHFTPGAWSVLPFLALPAYVWVALRRVYGGSALRTTVKSALIFGGYGIALTIAMSLMALVILFFVVVD
jgi:hypothetical protein